MARTGHIAVDLGAESGRVILGVLSDSRIELVECHRFRHLPVPTPAGPCWDITGLWSQVLEGLGHAATTAKQLAVEVRSIGVDTWAVDHALVTRAGSILGLPRCYRDPAFDAAMARVTAAVPTPELYRRTGIQLLPFNTLFQCEHRLRRDHSLAHAEAALLFIPDLFHWLLTGNRTVELTVASTSQMMDVRGPHWDTDLLLALGIPAHQLIDPSPASTDIGPLLPEIAAHTGLAPSTRVVLPAAHDTAAAVAAVPADPATRWCYLSSGTWSLLGAELNRPEITDAAAAANFTNELGAAGTVRFLKNISGLWLVQQVRRSIERSGRALEYAELTELAAGAEPLLTLFPANDPTLSRSPDLPTAIASYARSTGQTVPSSNGALVRACLESLALEYRRTLELLERTLGRSFDTLHIVGGGGRNGLLNRMTAHATGRAVAVGPEEATAMGNALTQAMAFGEPADLQGVRSIVAASISPQRIDPSRSSAWDDAYGRYLALPPAEDHHRAQVSPPAPAES